MQSHGIGTVSQAGASRLNTVTSCSLGPACWLWDFLRRSKQVGCFVPNYPHVLFWLVCESRVDSDVLLEGSVCEQARGQMGEAHFEAMWWSMELLKGEGILRSPNGCSTRTSPERQPRIQCCLLPFRKPVV